MQTSNCLELFIKLYAGKGYFSESALDRFNAIARDQITTQQLNNAGFYLVTSISTKVTNWFKKI